MVCVNTVRAINVITDKVINWLMSNPLILDYNPLSSYIVSAVIGIYDSVINWLLGSTIMLSNS